MCECAIEMRTRNRTMTIGKRKRPQRNQNFFYRYAMKRSWVDSKDRPAYACSMIVDFARLLARICSTVNSPPQTLQRQPADAAGTGATIDPGC